MLPARASAGRCARCCGSPVAVEEGAEIVVAVHIGEKRLHIGRRVGKPRPQMISATARRRRPEGGRSVRRLQRGAAATHSAMARCRPALRRQHGRRTRPAWECADGDFPCWRTRCTAWVDAAIDAGAEDGTPYALGSPPARGAGAERAEGVIAPDEEAGGRIVGLLAQKAAAKSARPRTARTPSGCSLSSSLRSTRAMRARSLSL